MSLYSPQIATTYDHCASYTQFHLHIDRDPSSHFLSTLSHTTTCRSCQHKPSSTVYPLENPNLRFRHHTSATGTLAIQYAKLSGYRVITTCSSHNVDLVKSLGVDEVFDYNSPNSAAEILRSTQNKLKLVLDTISTGSSAQYCDQALSTEGGEYTALLGNVGIERANVNDRWTLTYTVMGEHFLYREESWPAKPEDNTFAEKLLAEGRIKVHPIKVSSRGLKGVIEGLQDMSENKVGGKKLVYNIAETP